MKTVNQSFYDENKIMIDIKFYIYLIALSIFSFYYTFFFYLGLKTNGALQPKHNIP